MPLQMGTSTPLLLRRSRNRLKIRLQRPPPTFVPPPRRVLLATAAGPGPGPDTSWPPRINRLMANRNNRFNIKGNTSSKLWPTPSHPTPSSSVKAGIPPTIPIPVWLINSPIRTWGALSGRVVLLSASPLRTRGLAPEGINSIMAAFSTRPCPRPTANRRRRWWMNRPRRIRRNTRPTWASVGRACTSSSRHFSERTSPERGTEISGEFCPRMAS